MTKHFILVVAMLISFVAGAAVANAAEWRTVTITQAGINGSTAYVQATDLYKGSFTARYFQIPTANQNAILATALSAISSGKNAALAVSNLAAGSSVVALFMNN
ncbi:MAG: hypothetical protein AAGU21_12455 [Solidesulfovibrio sp.]